MKRLLPFFYLFLTLHAFGETTPPPHQTQFYAIEEPLPRAKTSYYSPKISNVLKKWPPSYVPNTVSAENPIWVKGIRTPDRPNYIGLVKRVFIQASLETVAKQVEEFEKYISIFPELRKIKVLERDGNHVYTQWERASPLFFVPNIKYEQAYVIDNRQSDRKIYRYQLISGNSVNFSDGIVVLERSREATILTAWDFFDANWGLARTLAEGTIWKKALAGSYKGDLAFLLKAEHPEMNEDQLEDAVDKVLDKNPLEKIEFLENFEL